MELTKTQYGMTLFPITEENQETVFLFLYEDEEMMRELMMLSFGKIETGP